MTDLTASVEPAPVEAPPPRPNLYAVLAYSQVDKHWQQPGKAGGVYLTREAAERSASMLSRIHWRHPCIVTIQASE